MPILIRSAVTPVSAEAADISDDNNNPSAAVNNLFFILLLP